MSNPAQEDAEILIPDWVVAYYDRAIPEVYESSAARISYLLRAPPNA